MNKIMELADAYADDLFEQGLNKVLTQQAEDIRIELQTELADALEAVGHFKACPGIPRKGCNYTATCNQVCNKCGEVHYSHQLSAALEAAQPAPQVPMTNEDILADKTLRYYFGLNSGNGPVSDKGLRIVRATESFHKIGVKS